MGQPWLISPRLRRHDGCLGLPSLKCITHIISRWQAIGWHDAGPGAHVWNPVGQLGRVPRPGTEACIAVQTEAKSFLTSETTLVHPRVLLSTDPRGGKRSRLLIGLGARFAARKDTPWPF